MDFDAVARGSGSAAPACSCRPGKPGARFVDFDLTFIYNPNGDFLLRKK
jgi:hypothetical protein